MKKKYTITGMTCAACSAGIERTVKKLNGVASAAVSLMGESMEAEFDETLVSDEEIKSAVTALGYGAYDYGQAPQKKRAGSFLKYRFWISLVLLIPEMLSLIHIFHPLAHAVCARNFGNVRNRYFARARYQSNDGQPSTAFFKRRRHGAYRAAR